MATQRYDFRSRTRKIREEVDSKCGREKSVAVRVPRAEESDPEASFPPRKKAKIKKAHGLKSALIIKATKAHKSNAAVKKVQENVTPVVKIPGLTLLEGQTAELTDAPAERPASVSRMPEPEPSAMEATARRDLVSDFDAAIRIYLAAMDECGDKEVAPSTERKTRSFDEELHRKLQEAFERALSAQESAAKGLSEALDSLALGRYFLKVYAESKVPVGETLKTGVILPNMSTQSPVDNFPWLKLDWVSGSTRQIPGEAIIATSPRSTPHTVSLSLIPEPSSSLEPVEVYSRTFDHRIESCPYPSLCPLCRYRDSDTVPLIAQSVAQAPSTLPDILISPPPENFPDDQVQNQDKEARHVLEDDPQRLRKPPSPEPQLSEGIPPTSLPLRRLVGVSLVNSEGNEIGEPGLIDTKGCTSFEDFKERIGAALAAVFDREKIPFAKTIHDKFELFNDSKKVMDNEDGAPSKNIWEEFLHYVAENSRGKEAGDRLGLVEVELARASDRNFDI